MKKFIKNKGFTLIELLVVIAIIGMLASIVLVSLNSARNKGKDTRVISSVQQLRTLVEADYNGQNYNASFSAANTMINTGNYLTLRTDITNQGSVFNSVNTANPTNAYALYGRLVSDTTRYFCIDSTGDTNTSASANTAAVCP